MSSTRTSTTRGTSAQRGTEIVGSGAAFGVTVGTDAGGMPGVSLGWRTFARGVRSAALGPRALASLISALDAAAREAFGADRWESYRAEALPTFSLVPPGERDDVYSPGQPWRRGKWIGPVATMPRWERARNAEHGR